QPSINRVVAWVQARIAELPTGPADATDPLTPWVTYATDGIQLRFRFRRRRSSSPPKPTDRIVGTGQPMGGFVDSFLRLRSGLETVAAGQPADPQVRQPIRNRSVPR